MNTKPLIVFLTGAGISKPSGIPTFRDSFGLWQNNDIEDVATLSAYRRDPKSVIQFFNQFNSDLKYKEPNKAHKVISALEKDYNVITITQNIDLLHEKSGSTNVIHLHGKSDEIKCMSCGLKYKNNNIDPIQYGFDECIYCHSTKIKHNIILFQEQLDIDAFELAKKYIYDSDLFIQVGTSASVLPASNLIKKALPRRKRVEMNITRSSPYNPHLFQHYYIGNIIETIDQFVLDISKLLPSFSRDKFPFSGKLKDKERYTKKQRIFISNKS